MKPHIHAELIKAWADGSEIEYFNTTDNKWKPIFKGWSWDSTLHIEMRIKPQLKPDKVEYAYVKYSYHETVFHWHLSGCDPRNLKLTFDGETGKLKSAEVL